MSTRWRAIGHGPTLADLDGADGSDARVPAGREDPLHGGGALCEQVREVRAALDELPASWRSVLYLRDGLDRSYRGDRRGGGRHRGRGPRHAAPGPEALVATDIGLEGDSGFFHWERHVPDEVPVVFEDETDDPDD